VRLASSGIALPFFVSFYSNSSATIRHYHNTSGNDFLFEP